MSVNEIEEAVLRLTPAELDAFRTWFAEFDAAASGPATEPQTVRPTMLSEVVIKVGAEGGSLTLLRERFADGGEWQFRTITDERYDFTDEFENADLVESRYVHSFEEALKLLDKYEWAELCPLHVHPQFVEAVRLAVNKRRTDARNKRTDANEELCWQNTTNERNWRDILKL